MAGLERLVEAPSRCLPGPSAHPQDARRNSACSPRPTGRLVLLEPLGYHASLCLTENARVVLTDSGGLQEEATYFRTPCLTLRPNTERPITVTLGSNRLTKLESFLGDIDALLAGPGAHRDRCRRFGTARRPDA